MRSLARRDATCTSRVRPVPSQLVRQTSLMICSRRKTTWALREEREKVELLAGQLDNRTVHADLPGGQLDEHGTEAQPALGARGGVLVGGAPADGVDPGEQFSGVVRLHHVVVGAEVEAVDAGADVGAGGDHDHRGAGALADLAADLVAVLVGQPQVEQYDAEAVTLRNQRLESFLAATRVRDVETVPCQNRGKSGGDMVVVLDEEQSHPGLLRFIGRTIRMDTKTRARARVHQGSHADGRQRRQAGSGCTPL